MEEEKMKAENEQAAETAEDKKDAEKGKPMTFTEALVKAGKGVFKLKKPIRAKGEDISELRYDFSALSAFETFDAIDRGTPGKKDSCLSYDQALKLFAAAVSKEMNELDSTDIEQRISNIDAIPAAREAKSFFNLSSLPGGISFTSK